MGNSGAFERLLPDNVIAWERHTETPTLSYLYVLTGRTSGASALPAQMGRHHVCYFESEIELSTALALATPSVILISSETTWCDPLTLISSLRGRGVPLMLLLEKPQAKNAKRFLKDAYKAGIDDALYLPLDRYEIARAIEVLLKVKIADQF